MMVSERLAGMDVSHQEDFLARSRDPCVLESAESWGIAIINLIVALGYFLSYLWMSWAEGTIWGEATHLPDFLQDLSLEHGSVLVNTRVEWVDMYGGAQPTSQLAACPSESSNPRFFHYSTQDFIARLLPTGGVLSFKADCGSEMILRVTRLHTRGEIIVPLLWILVPHT